MITTLSIISLDQGRIWREEPTSGPDEASLAVARRTLVEQLTDSVRRARAQIEDARPAGTAAPEA